MGLGSSSLASLPVELPVLTPHYHRVFAECHKFIPPDAFFRTCVSDHCNGNFSKTLCQSLEVYAALCRIQGVCTDWRNATGGLCGKLESFDLGLHPPRFLNLFDDAFCAHRLLLSTL